MDFNYSIITGKGERQSGVIKAPSREAAIRILHKPGVFVTSLEEIKKPLFYERFGRYSQALKIFGRVSRKDMVIFSRQLAIMYKSGVRLPDALRSLGDQAKSPLLKEKITKITEEVEGGTPFSQAISYYPELFNSLYVNMAKSGEASGKLSESLDYLAEHLEREHYTISKIKEALAYPAFILIVFLGVITIMTLFVIPQLMTVIEGAKLELPLVTRIIIGTASFLRRWILVLILILSISFFFIFQHFKTHEAREKLEQKFLKIPLIGDYLKKIYLSRFAENLSVLIKGGLGVVRALEISAEITENIIYKKIILNVRDEVIKGESISLALKGQTDVIPPLFVQMTLVGEKTGRLSNTLMNIVNYYKVEIEAGTETFLKFIEPVMIILLGIIIGALAVGVLIPIYDIMAI